MNAVKTDDIPTEIRPATPADIPAIVRVTNLAYEVEAFCLEGRRIDAEEVRERMESGQFLVIEDASDASVLRGSAYMSVVDGRGYLGLLSVDPACQGRGLARALITAVEVRSRLAGCSFLDITVVNLRKELFPFYTKLGFAPAAILPFPRPQKMLQPLHLVQMTKALRPVEEL